MESTINQAAWQIMNGDQMVGRLRKLNTVKGDRWVLSFYAADGSDPKPKFFLGLDAAITSMYRNKPAGSMAIKLA